MNKIDQIPQQFIQQKRYIGFGTANIISDPKTTSTNVLNFPDFHSLSSTKNFLGEINYVEWINLCF